MGRFSNFFSGVRPGPTHTTTSMVILFFGNLFNFAKPLRVTVMWLFVDGRLNSGFDVANRCDYQDGIVSVMLLFVYGCTSFWF